jgi:DNA-binding SARP family transcriptional activator
VLANRSDDVKLVMDRGGRVSAVRLSLLHGFELTSAGKAVRVSGAGQRLLAFLALNPRPLARSYVAARLWIDSTGERARANLRSTLWRVTQLDLSLIDKAGDCLGLAEHVNVDVREAEARARRLLDSDHHGDDRDAEELTKCGELLPAWYEDWVLIERERERQLLLHALEALCERLTVQRRFGQAIAAGIAAVQGEPLRESAHRALINAYLAEGNLGEAIRQYNVCRRLFRNQLGLEPSAHMVELIQANTQQAAPLETASKHPSRRVRSVAALT